MKIGDVVRLIGGGPKMTVIETKDGIKCGWFNTQHEYQSEVFMARTLVGVIYPSALDCV